ncbi:MAG: hypothetical protein VKJ24_00360 [Synechococcales bacterium]|nr:hypothetical protein [Synechococcales bacterium]
MVVKTRGSTAIDKAQRRMASLKSIDEALDLGYDLNLENYTQLIEATRQQVEQYNVLLSHLEDARHSVLAMEEQLSTFSERMLAGILVKYGRDSKEYSKAGGATRRGKPTQTALPPIASSPISPDPIAQQPTIAPTVADDLAELPLSNHAIPARKALKAMLN